MFLLNIDNREVTENLDSHSIRQCSSWILIISTYQFNSIQKTKTNCFGCPLSPQIQTGRKEGGGGREGRGKGVEEGREGKKQIKLPLTIKPKSYMLTYLQILLYINN